MRAHAAPHHRMPGPIERPPQVAMGPHDPPGERGAPRHGWMGLRVDAARGGRDEKPSKNTISAPFGRCATFPVDPSMTEACAASARGGWTTRDRPCGFEVASRRPWVQKEVQLPVMVVFLGGGGAALALSNGPPRRKGWGGMLMRLVPEPKNTHTETTWWTNPFS